MSDSKPKKSVRWLFAKLFKNPLLKQLPKIYFRSYLIHNFTLNELRMLIIGLQFVGFVTIKRQSNPFNGR
jgi:hypothetical protein